MLGNVIGPAGGDGGNATMKRSRHRVAPCTEPRARHRTGQGQAADRMHDKTMIPAGESGAGETRRGHVIPVSSHSEKNLIRLQLRKNEILEELSESAREELEAMLIVVDKQKGDFLLHQGMREMEQYFILNGVLKRVVSNAQGKEMILRFAAEGDMETSYAAWRMGTPTPYGIVCVTRARVARLPMPQWAAFLERHRPTKEWFESCVMRLMSEVMAHTITLHLLDAPGRVHRFERKRPDLLDRIPQKQLASHLNLSPETLSRLRQSGKI